MDGSQSPVDEDLGALIEPDRVHRRVCTDPRGLAAIGYVITIWLLMRFGNEKAKPCHASR